MKIPLVRTRVYFAPEWRHGYAWLFPKNDRANVGLGMRETAPGEAWRALEWFLADLTRQGLVELGVAYKSVGAIPVGGLRPRLVLPRSRLPRAVRGATPQG